jgi:hypothetical protein
VDNERPSLLCFAFDAAMDAEHVRLGGEMLQETAADAVGNRALLHDIPEVETFRTLSASWLVVNPDRVIHELRGDDLLDVLWGSIHGEFFFLRAFGSVQTPSGVHRRPWSFWIKHRETS